MSFKQILVTMKKYLFSESNTFPVFTFQSNYRNLWIPMFTLPGDLLVLTLEEGWLSLSFRACQPL